MHPDTWDARKKAKLLNDDLFAEQLAVFYRDNEITDLGDVDDAPPIGRTIAALFGVNLSDIALEELREQVMEMTRAGGLVQKALSNSGNPMVLCTTSVRIKLVDSDDGSEYVVRQTARFASSNEDVVYTFFDRPIVISAERTLERTAMRLAMSESRVPALGQWRKGLIDRIHGTVAAELPQRTK
jgi:hypothetical protein